MPDMDWKYTWNSEFFAGGCSVPDGKFYRTDWASSSFKPISKLSLLALDTIITDIRPFAADILRKTNFAPSRFPITQELILELLKIKTSPSFTLHIGFAFRVDGNDRAVQEDKAVQLKLNEEGQVLLDNKDGYLRLAVEYLQLCKEVRGAWYLLKLAS